MIIVVKQAIKSIKDVFNIFFSRRYSYYIKKEVSRKDEVCISYRLYIYKTSRSSDDW